ncbi:MAG TPA: hypothetical protein VEY67_12605 [Candidatus Dormibacteraeota bacterium]|nr:hypothetical protein [Candidatus Dormibacteraeota bacterium]
MELVRISVRRSLAAAVLAAIPLVTAAGLSAASAADPFVAGQPATRQVGPPDAAAPSVDHARRLLRALGLRDTPGAAALRVEDLLESATYDEVTFRDERGRPTLLVRLRPDGSLRHLARLDAPDTTAPRIDAGRAASRAKAVATASDVPHPGEPVVRDDPSSGWAVAWPRVEKSVPVLGDGTWIRLDRDGTVRSVAITAAALAGQPSAALSELAARQLAERALDRLVVEPTRPQARIADARLAWVAPNDTFDASRPDAPDPTRRLAWVIRVQTTGPLAERMRGFELDLDAGTGELLGGDVLE